MPARTISFSSFANSLRLGGMRIRPWPSTQEGLVRDLFLDHPPFVVREDHQITVPVRDDQTAVVFLGKYIAESGGENDSPFIIDGVVILAPKDRHWVVPPL
jgi:hypothetical protein